MGDLTHSGTPTHFPGEWRILDRIDIFETKPSIEDRPLFWNFNGAEWNS
jgi:hypothetical protein